MSQVATGSFGAFEVPNFRILFGGILASFTAFFTLSIVQGVVAFRLAGTNTGVGAPEVWTAIGCTVLVAPTSGGFHALDGAVIARRTETVYLGRIMSLSLLASAGFSLTALPLGMLADLYGERRALLGTGAGVFVVASGMSLVVVKDALRSMQLARVD